MMEPFISVKNMQKFIEAALGTTTTRQGGLPIGWKTSTYAYRMIFCSIPLEEVCTLSALHDEAGWMPETLAVSRIYKLFDRLGRNTTGIAGF